MTMGPAPMIRTVWISVRLGILQNLVMAGSEGRMKSGRSATRPTMCECKEARDLRTLGPAELQVKATV